MHLGLDSETDGPLPPLDVASWDHALFLTLSPSDGDAHDDPAPPDPPSPPPSDVWPALRPLCGSVLLGPRPAARPGPAAVDPDGALLDRIFTRRLRDGDDELPLVLIHADPERVLAATTPDALAYYLNDRWHAALCRSLRHLPAAPAAAPVGSWGARRLWLERAQAVCLFPVPPASP